MKQSGWGLQEIGYSCPMDEIMYIDLVVLQAAINHKQKMDSDKMKRGIK